MKKTLIALLCLMASLALMFSCIGFAEETGRDDVLATVNGVPVTRGTVDDSVMYFTAYYTSQGYDVSDEESQAVIRSVCLSDAVDNELIAQHASELDAALSEDEIASLTAEMKELWNSTVDTAARSSFGLTDESTEEEKAAIYAQVEESIAREVGFTADSFIAQNITAALSGKVTEALGADLTVSDEEAQAYYDEGVANEQAQLQAAADSYGMSLVQFYEYYQYSSGTAFDFTPEGYRGIIQILLQVDEDALNTYKQLKEDINASAEQVEEARLAVIASVQDTVDEINEKFAAGTPFTDLITLYNTDPGMDDPTNLAEGYAVHRESIMWDPAFVEATFSLDEVGQMSAPYVGEYGIYIVYYLRDVPAGPMELTDEMRARLKDSLLSEKKNTALLEKLDQWESEADIVYTDAAAPYRTEIPQ